MIESLRTTQLAFFRFATVCGFFRGSADEVQKVSVQGFVQEKIIWNHLWEHCFSVPDPCVFPPPGDHFLTLTTESPFYDWAHRQPSNKNATTAAFSLTCLEIRLRNEEVINSTWNRIYSLKVFYFLLYPCWHALQIMILAAYTNKTKYRKRR